MGTNAEYIVLKESEALAIKPARATFEEAAAKRGTKKEAWLSVYNNIAREMFICLVKPQGFFLF